jgi:hypothetical protein
MTSYGITGALTTFSWLNNNNIGQTASTEINGWLYNTSTRQWATGAITTQREMYITSPTYSFVGASTITNAYTFYVEAPTAGTNATITNSWAAGFNGNVFVGTATPVSSQRMFQVAQDTAYISMGSLIGATSYGAIYIDVASPALTTYSIASDGTSLLLNAQSVTVDLKIANVGKLSIGTSTITVTDAVNFVMGSTSGNKIGTATSQKIGFWNATPIVQPTTGVAAATFVANTSGIVNDTATFDGYTIGQVVKALRNTGLLA